MIGPSNPNQTWKEKNDESCDTEQNCLYQTKTKNHGYPGEVGTGVDVGGAG